MRNGQNVGRLVWLRDEGWWLGRKETTITPVRFCRRYFPQPHPPIKMTDSLFISDRFPFVIRKV